MSYGKQNLDNTIFPYIANPDGVYALVCLKLL